MLFFSVNWPSVWVSWPLVSCGRPRKVILHNWVKSTPWNNRPPDTDHYSNTQIHKYTNTQTQTQKYTNNSEHLGPTHHSLLKFTNTETQNTNYIHTWTNTQIFQNWIKWTPWSKPPAWHKSLLSWSILRLIHKTINFHPSPVSSPLHIKFISYVLGAGLNLLRSFRIYFSFLSLLPANIAKETSSQAR